MIAGIAVDGVDLGVAVAARDTTVRLSIGAAPDAWTGLALSPGTIDAGPGALGPALSTALGAAGARELTITLRVTASSPAALDAALVELSRAVPPGPVLAVSLAARADVEWWAQRTRFVVTKVSPRLVQRRADVELGFTATPPVLRSRAVRVVRCASTDATPTPLPLGTLPVAPRLRVTAGATTPAVDPVLTVTDSAGRTVATLTLDASLGAGAWLDVDCATATIRDQTGAYAGSARIAGDFFTLDPADTPSLAVSVTSGSARVEAVYSLHWDA